MTKDTIASVTEETRGPSIFQNRYFLCLWMAQVISQIAQNAINFGLLVLVQERTNSTTHMAVAVLSFIMPSVLFGILAGVYVDRAQKKTVLFITNGLRAVVVLGYIAFDQYIGMIYLVSFLFSIISQFFAPAEAAAIPMLVRREQLITANSLFNLTFNASQLIGMVLVAPLMIKLFGTWALFTTTAGLYVLAALLVSVLPKDRRTPVLISADNGQRMVRGVWQEVKEGWRILTADLASSLAMLHLTLASTLMPLVAVLGPNYVVNVVRLKSEDMAYVFFPAGMGMLSGTMAMNRLAQRFGKSLLIHAGLAIMGTSLFGMAWAKVGGGYLLYNILGRFFDVSSWPVAVEMPPVVMFLGFFLGLAFALVNIPAQTILQERCPLSFRGRIFAVQFTLSSAVSIIPLLFVGSIADIIGVNKTITLVGILILAFLAVSIRAEQHSETANRG